MIKVRVRVSSGTSNFAVEVCAESLRRATQSVRERFPGSTVGIAFPIEPELFFAEDDRREGVVLSETRAEELVNQGMPS